MPRCSCRRADLAVGEGDAAGTCLEEGVGLDRLDARPHLDQRRLHERCDIRGVAIVRVERDRVADRPAEEHIDWLTHHFPADIPERDIHAADHRRRRAARAHVGEDAEELVPDRLDVRRVLADEEGADLAQHRGDAPVGDGAGIGGDLAPARDAFVGLDLHEDILPLGRATGRHIGAGVLAGAGDDPRGHVGDLHGGNPTSLAAQRWPPGDYYTTATNASTTIPRAICGGCHRSHLIGPIPLLRLIRCRRTTSVLACGFVPAVAPVYRPPLVTITCAESCCAPASQITPPRIVTRLSRGRRLDT